MTPTPQTGSMNLGGLTMVETPTGVTFTLAYTEPTANTAGGPPGLTKTTIYWKLNNGPETAIVVAASSPNGGGPISMPLTVPILPGQIGTVAVQVTASNATGESVRSPVVTKTDDRSGQVVPGPPTGLTIS